MARYRTRISGPLLDRIDLRVDVPALESRELESGARGESSSAVRARICAARERQAHRQLSARSHHRVLKVARTIADLEGRTGVAAEHVAEALQYR